MEELNSIFTHAWAQLRAIEQGGTSQEVPPSPVSSDSEARVSQPSSEGNPTEEIEAIRSRKNSAFSRMNRLHASLEWLPSDKQRLSAGLEILELEREVQACWKAIDHFTQTGEVVGVSIDPAEEEPFDPAGFDMATLVKMRNSARSYISKARSKGYPEHKIRERQERISAIEEYLNKE